DDINTQKTVPKLDFQQNALQPPHDAFTLRRHPTEVNKRRKSGGGEVSHMILPKKSLSPKYACHVKLQQILRTHYLPSKIMLYRSTCNATHTSARQRARARITHLFCFRDAFACSIHKNTPKRCMGRLTENEQNNEERRETHRNSQSLLHCQRTTHALYFRRDDASVANNTCNRPIDRYLAVLGTVS
ncbi:hypothetical protein WUBG_14994, partial [Wuchereria bancrofti]